MTGSFAGWRGYLRHLALTVGALAAAVGIALTSGPAPAASPAEAAAAAPATVSGNVALARSMAASQQNWTGQQWDCLYQLWNHESGFRADAYNSSGATGIPQALPGSKMAAAGPDWATNPATQIKWGLGYIHSRYGTPCGAWAIYCVNTPSHPVNAQTGACWY
jgi:hypothetical protein